MSPPALLSTHYVIKLITISTNHKKRRKGGGEKALRWRNAVFCLQWKGGKRECQRKCQGGPTLLPLMVRDTPPPAPGPHSKGKRTHPLRICPSAPASTRFAVARQVLPRTVWMCTINRNLRVVALKVSRDSWRNSCCRNFLFNLCCRSFLLYHAAHSVGTAAA